MTPLWHPCCSVVAIEAHFQRNQFFSITIRIQFQFSWNLDDFFVVKIQGTIFFYSQQKPFLSYPDTWVNQSWTFHTWGEIFYSCRVTRVSPKLFLDCGYPSTAAFQFSMHHLSSRVPGYHWQSTKTNPLGCLGTKFESPGKLGIRQLQRFMLALLPCAQSRYRPHTPRNPSVVHGSECTHCVLGSFRLCAVLTKQIEYCWVQYCH